MSAIIYTVLTQPLFNLLVVLYKYVTFADLGFAIILLTIIVRILLYPVFYRGMKSQTMMQRMQPEVARIQRENKDNREKQAAALMQLYKENKMNPFSPFLYILIQLPILYALYHIFALGLSAEALTNLYSFVTPPADVHASLFGLLDPSKPSMIIVIVATVLQYVQSRLSLAKSTSTSGMAKYMVYLGPVFTLIIFPRFSAAVSLYWATSIAFSILQQHLINKHLAAHGSATGKN